MRLFQRVSILLVFGACAAGALASAQDLPEWAAPYEPTGPYGSGFAEPGTEHKGWKPTDFPDPPDQSPSVPIDGGLGLLAAAGAGYAIKKLRRRA